VESCSCSVVAQPATVRVTSLPDCPIVQAEKSSGVYCLGRPAEPVARSGGSVTP